MVSKTCDSANFVVLLAEVRLMAISVAAMATVSANGTSVTIRKAVPRADRATVAGETTTSTTDI